MFRRRRIDRKPDMLNPSASFDIRQSQRRARFDASRITIVSARIGARSASRREILLGSEIRRQLSQRRKRQERDEAHAQSKCGETNDFRGHAGHRTRIHASVKTKQLTAAKRSRAYEAWDNLVNIDESAKKLTTNYRISRIKIPVCSYYICEILKSVIHDFLWNCCAVGGNL